MKNIIKIVILSIDYTCIAVLLLLLTPIWLPAELYTWSIKSDNPSFINYLKTKVSINLS
jgi:hypothetical protein